MIKHLFIGVDGGATKSIVRVEDAEGNILGREVGRPASIRISVADAWDSINCTVKHIFQKIGLDVNKHAQIHIGMGLAGCEVIEAYQAFTNYSHPFKTLVVSSDSHTACLGAHQGREGAIIIVGTGVVGYQLYSGLKQQIGGWGFPHDDEGGGAWLGLEATKLTLKCLDGRHAYCELAHQIYNYFANNKNDFISWANRANSRAFAELAPIVIQLSQAGDNIAQNLLRNAAKAIDAIGTALEHAQQAHRSILPCALIGSIAPFLQGFLGQKLTSRLCDPKSSPDAGAILLVRQYLNVSAV